MPISGSPFVVTIGGVSAEHTSAFGDGLVSPVVIGRLTSFCIATRTEHNQAIHTHPRHSSTPTWRDYAHGPDMYTHAGAHALVHTHALARTHMLARLVHAQACTHTHTHAHACARTCINTHAHTALGPAAQPPTCPADRGQTRR